jgi:glycosyltransferase involved in cell wall biosynthesis
MNRKRISFVIPVYRNERAVTLTYQKIRTICEAQLPDLEREFVFVDDGSDDGSLQELLAIRSSDSNVRVISFTRNFGQMAAIQAGLREATGDIILQLSADLQDPAELIPEMVESHRKGNEVVVACRADRSDSLRSKLSSRLFYGILRLSFPQIPPGGFDYLLMGRRALDVFNEIDVRNQAFQTDVLWLGFPTAFIPYTRLKRTIGRSQYTFMKRLKNALDAILDASYLPIRFMSLLGIITALCGFLYAANIVYYRLIHYQMAPGWAPLMVVLLVVSGLIMVILGIIGEYIWRIYNEVKGKPKYIIREKY